MKSVFLNNEHLSELLKNEIGFEEGDSYKQNLSSYHKMWKDQGQEFWLKFVISCKEILGTHTGYHSSPFNVDVIYIDFMKALLHHNFDKITDFILFTALMRTEYTSLLPHVTKIGITEVEKVKNPSEVMCKLVRLSFQMRMAGAFVRMLQAWEYSQIGSDFKWKFPNYWLISGNENEKLELYIKSKWSVKEIVKMFGCKKKVIVWLGQSTSLESEHVHFQAIVSTLTQDQKKQLVTSPQTYLGWLPKQNSTKTQQRVARNDYEIGIVEVMENVLEPFLLNGRLWHLIQTSLPPLLARKYHIVNVAELMNGGVDRHYMGVATWFVMWNQAFGVQFLNFIVNKHKELDKLNEIPEIRGNRWKGTRYETQVKNWQNDIDLFLKQIKKTRAVESAPKPEDNATNALTFLLEPCIIIQLPWNNVLFHQWLAAALVEVLLFEKSSMEFRHWPFSYEVAKCATSLITLVKQLKEKIMLGFTIMSKQANSYPQVDAKHPEWIMDEVVLPSLSILHFLITGKAYNILKSLKKHAWSNSKPKVFMSHNAFEMRSSMTILFVEFCYSYFCFEYPRAYPPFPLHQCESKKCHDDDLRVLIPELKHKETDKELTPCESCDIIKKYSQEEIFLNGMFKENSGALNKHSKEHVEKALKIIKEHVVDPGRLPGLTMEKVRQKFDTDLMRKSVAEMWDKEEIKIPEELVILHALLLDECYIKLIGSDREVNLMSKLINLGVEVLEREQIIRLTNVLGIIFNITPIAIKLDDKPPLSIESMSSLIKDCEKKCESQNRDWLWSQLPAEWNKPVSVFMSEEVENLLKSSQAEAKGFMKSLEQRIGSIVFNLAQTSFSVYQSGGEMFEDWQTVQYILPCFVAAYVELINDSVSSKMTHKVFQMYKLVDKLIMYYEEKYLSWAIHIIQRKTPDISKQIMNNINKSYCREISILSLYYKDITVTLLNAHVHTGRNCEGMIGFDQIRNAMLQWPIDIEMDPRTGHEQAFFAFVTWLENSFYFLKNIYENCVDAWKIPLPGSNIPDEKLGSMYLADSVMHVLETVFGMYTIYIPPQHLELPDINAIFDKSGIGRCLNQWRYELLNAVMTNCKNPTKTTPLFIESERKIKVEVYRLIKKFRNFSGAINLQFVDNFPSNPPVLKLAAKYFNEAEFDKLDKILSIIVPVETKNKKVEAPKPVTRNKCRNCPKRERYWESFIVCEKCVEQKYPDFNYFCSKECKEKWWKEEHQAEHLEFELGLLDFKNVAL